MNHPDLSKMQALVRSDNGRMSPLRERPQHSERSRARDLTQERSLRHDSQQHTIASDFKSSKTVPKASKSQGRCGPGYEPMRHKRPSENEGGRPNAVQQVQMIEDLRQQKEAIQRAFSEEKTKNFSLADRTKFQESKLAQLEREVIDLRAVNVRLHDSEAATTREVEQLRDRNALLTSEGDHMRK